MPRERYLRTIRLLAESYQAFERLSGRHVRALGLTPAQFDIVATLGNTPGMSFRELGERTLITKGTLTGVIDRMQAAGWVVRESVDADRRTVRVRLTRSGERLFAKVFPAHVAWCGRAFAAWQEHDFAELESRLTRLRDTIARTPNEPE